MTEGNGECLEDGVTFKRTVIAAMDACALIVPPPPLETQGSIASRKWWRMLPWLIARHCGLALTRLGGHHQ